MASFCPSIGNRVVIQQANGKEVNGTVKFFGNTQFKSGNWVGLELDCASGKHDGCVEGERYFECKQGHGVFVRPNMITDIPAKKLKPDSATFSSGTESLEERKSDEKMTDFWFEVKARGFVFNKSNQQWIELGTGSTEFHWDPEQKRVILKLCESDELQIDHLVDPSTKIEKTIITQQSWVFRAHRRVDPATRDVLCLQFSTMSVAGDFVSSFEKHRSSISGLELKKKKKSDKSAGDNKEPERKTRVMRRRLTVSGSDPHLDGHRNGARMEPTSPQPTSPKALRAGEVGQWKHGEEDSLIEITAYSGVSRKGVAPYNPDKQNQDSMIMKQLPHNGYCKGELLLCVFDGHGENGHHVSRFFKSRLAKILESSPKFSQDEFTGTVLADAMLTIENELIQNRAIDTTLSGTTAVVTILRGTKLFVANVGDSRIAKGVIKQIKNQLRPRIVAHDLSEDHKPDLEKERQRILKSGGRVFAMKYDDGIDGPARVWLSYADMPGLAMSRSLCDTIGKEAGVISNAELFTHELCPGKDKFIVLATDGLWEFMSSQEVCDIVSKHVDSADTRSAINELIRESNKRWQREEPVIDDTTIIVAFLK